jgi:hypothetical protein
MFKGLTTSLFWAVFLKPFEVLLQLRLVAAMGFQVDVVREPAPPTFGSSASVFGSSNTKKSRHYRPIQAYSFTKQHVHFMNL